MKNMQQLAVATLAVVGATASVASYAAEQASPWKTTAELGYVVTSGNSETSTINAKIDATHEVKGESWRHNVHAEAFGAKTTDTATGIETRSAERYQLSGKSDYKFNDTDYAFITLNYDKDRFSGYDYQATLAGGYGKRVINDKDMTLDFEIGPGVRSVKESVSQQTDTEGLVRLGAKYVWKISDNATFSEDFTSDIASNLTVTKSVTALTANINSSLAMKLTLTVKNNSEVPAGKEKTDTETAVTLVYSF